MTFDPVHRPVEGAAETMDAGPSGPASRVVAARGKRTG
jgi:hypothetical protein